LLLLACCLNELLSFGIVEQPRGDLLGSDEALVLPVRLLDNAGDDREGVSLFPRWFHSRVTQAAERPPSRAAA
jgi:hypothetical protein